MTKQVSTLFKVVRLTSGFVGGVIGAASGFALGMSFCDEMRRTIGRAFTDAQLTLTEFRTPTEDEIEPSEAEIEEKILDPRFS